MYFLGRRLRFGGVGRDWVLRLFRRGTGKYLPLEIHEKVDVDGTVSRLQGSLEHFSYATLEEYLEKIPSYTAMAARQRFAAGARFTVLHHATAGVGALQPGRSQRGLAGRPGRPDLRRPFQPRGLAARGEVVGARTFEAWLGFSSSAPTGSGTCCLTTPVSTALREAFPRAGISWLVRAYTAPLLQHNPDVDQVLVDDGGSGAELAALIRREKFDVAIVALPRRRIAWALVAGRGPDPDRAGEQALFPAVHEAALAAPLRGEETRGRLQPGIARSAGRPVQAPPDAAGADGRGDAGGPRAARIPGHRLLQAARDPAPRVGRLVGPLAARALHGAGRHDCRRAGAMWS